MTAGHVPHSPAAGSSATGVSLAGTERDEAFEHFPDATIVVDANWRISLANAEARRRLDIESEGAVNLWDVMPEAIEQARDAHYHRAMNDRVAVRFEQQAPGGGAWFVVRAVPHAGGGLLIVYSDVTEIKRSDEDLRDREDRYRLLFDRNPQPMFAYDTETFRFVMVNDAVVSRYGYSRPEMLGLTVFDIHLPEDKAKLADLIARIRRDPVSFSGVWQHRRKDGTTFPVEVVSQGITLGGRAVRIVVAVDVTDRRRAELSLRESEQRLRLVTDASNDGIWELDLNTQSLYWSDRVFEMLRLDRGTFSGHRDSNITRVHPDDRARAEAAIAAHLERDEPYDVETRLQRGDGTYGIFRSRGKALRDPDTGKPLRMAGSISETTKQHEAAEALRASEDLHRTLGEAMPMLTWSLRVDGRYEYVNPRFTEVLGLTADEASRVGWPGLVHPDDLDVLMRRWETERSVPQPAEIEVRYRIADGSYRWFLVRGAPVLDEAQNVRRWIGVGMDIDDLKRAQAELQQAKDAAEAANEAKDQFLAVLSHELRTPLTPVMLEASALREDPALDSAVRESIQMISEQVELEARLIDDLLDLTRITRNKFALNMVDLDAHDVVRRAIDVCAPTISAVNVKLQCELRAGRLRLHADPTRLHQVLCNLLNNAAKFTPAGGTITVRTWDESEGTGTAPATFVIEVSDTGVGIEPALLPRIFNAFEQGERSITRTFGGLGLGLTIGKAIAEVHGGTLSAASEGHNRGATLTLRLPAGGAEAPSPSTTTSASEQRSHAWRVLVVDDHETTLRLMARLLRSLGHDVRAAGSASRALEMALADCPDLLISDIGMPNQSGWSLLSELRSRCPAPLRAIAISGYGTDEDIQRSLDAGFSEHLVKPIDLERLKAAIERAMATTK